MNGRTGRDKKYKQIDSADSVDIDNSVKIMIMSIAIMLSRNSNRVS